MKRIIENIHIQNQHTAENNGHHSHYSSCYMMCNIVKHRLPAKKYKITTFTVVLQLIVIAPLILALHLWNFVRYIRIFSKGIKVGKDSIIAGYVVALQKGNNQ